MTTANKRLVLSASSSVIFILAYPVFAHFFVGGELFAAFSIVPITTLAWNYGKRIGLIAAVVTIVFTEAIFSTEHFLVHHNGISFYWAIIFTATTLVLLFVGFVVGELGDTLAKLRQTVHSWRQTEDALTSALETSRQYLDVAGVIILVLDRDARIVLLNKKGHSVLGYREGELVGKDYIATCIPERMRDEMKGAFGRLMNGEPSAEQYENPVLTKDGEERLISWHNTLLKDRKGNIISSLSSGDDITERRRSEEALRQSEAKFSLAFTNNPAAITLSRLEDGLLLEANDTWMKLTGYSRDEAIGNFTTTMGIWPSSEDAGLVRELKEKGSVSGWEQEFYKKSGEPFVAQLSAQLMTMRGEKVILSTLVDVTQRREAETALRTLVDAVPESVILTDTKGIALAANEIFARRFGRTARELVATQLYDLFPPEVAAARKRYADDAVRTGVPRHFEDVLDGRHLDGHVHPIKDSKGQVTRLAVLSLDITERKQAENKLKEQAALLDIASDAILAKELDGRIVYWNKGAERLYGWSAEEVKGKKTFELLYTEEHLAAGQEALREVTEKGEWRGELHQKTKDGKKLIVEARWTLIRDDKGKPKGVLSVKSDITAKRSIEAQLLRSQRLESLGTLAGGIAHDLNNVLAPILMGIEGLSFRNPDDYVRNILSIIKASAQRGANIVRQILNFARGMEGDIGEIQLKHVIREIESIIQETFPKSIALKTNTPKDLWPVNGDATQLHQVLMNLCVNARDAMPDGGWVTISAENVSLDETYAKMNIEAKPIRYVALKVEDTGTGMPPGVLEKIFDPFFTTKEPGKGTGLGLSTVRSIIKSHGGFVTVYSEPNKGTSFKVYIPAAEQEGQPKEAGPEEGIAMGERETILVVDDEVSLRDITRQILESYGYKVLTAADGTEAVTKFVEMKADIRLVITDMMMPYMDGAATIRAIRRIDPKAHIIATSGLMTSEYAKEAKGLGVQAFLAKPYTAEKLLHTLREVLEQVGEVSAL